MKKVILMIDISRASGRQFLSGIERYIHTKEEWEIHLQSPHCMSSEKMNLCKWIQQNQFDGIIVRDSPYLGDILKMDIPKIVFESGGEIFPGVITITSDCFGISKMAAEYFIGLGFKNFAYCGFENLPWSVTRLKAYRSILISDKDFRLFKYNCPRSIDDAVKEKHNIYEWIKTLPRPLCVFAYNDERAVNVLEVCKVAGFKVPEEIAVLGIDNDALICKLSYPHLSSIKVGFEKAGFEAAGVLNQQMHSKKSVADVTITAKPQYLVKRQSTDVIAVEDANVRKALIFIRKNFQKPIQVRDVVNATSCSRRILELLFKNYLKSSINDEIKRLRIEHIKLKLVNSHVPIYKIAESLKYTDTEHFSRFFKKSTSISPSEYRGRYGKI